MHQQVKDVVLELAWQARFYCESLAAARCVQEGEDPDDWKDLNGYCAIATAYLWRLLRAHGIKSEIHLCSGWDGCHAFLEIDDYVLDVTATQFMAFESQAVLLLHCKEAEQHWFYQTVQIFKSDRDLRVYQEKAHWPSDQIAITA